MAEADTVTLKEEDEDAVEKGVGEPRAEAEEVREKRSVKRPEAVKE